MARSLKKFSVDMELNKSVLEVPSQSIGMALLAFRRLNTFEMTFTKNYRSNVNVAMGMNASVYMDSQFLS